MQAVRYRPEIDGLRAVAVLSVIIFHLNDRWLPGGFLGVDIFFVISGFLITGIILSEIQNGSFSFQDFYTRRIKRIYPAFIAAVSLASVIASQKISTKCGKPWSFLRFSCPIFIWGFSRGISI